MIVVFKKIVLVDLFTGIVTERIEIDGRRQIEEQDYPDGAEKKFFDRFNNSKSFAFTATRQHATEDVAELFCHTHDEETLGVGPLLVKGTFRGWERFYNDAACTRCATYAEGVRTWSTYEFVTGLAAKKKIGS